MSEVALDGVSKRFGATQAVSDLSLTIENGAFVVLLGPTGRRQDDDVAPGRGP